METRNKGNHTKQYCHQLVRQRPPDKDRSKKERRAKSPKSRLELRGLNRWRGHETITEVVVKAEHRKPERERSCVDSKRNRLRKLKLADKEHPERDADAKSAPLGR